MSDQIYRPISDADEEAETHASTELPVESWSDFRAKLEDQANVSRDELSVEDAANATTLRRQETPTPENAHERPITRLRSKGGPQNLRQASEDLSWTRGLAKRDELLAAGHTEEELAELGQAQIAAAQRGDPLAPPPDEVKIADEWGKENEPLDAATAAAKIGEWRAEQQAQRQAELAELTGELEARQQQPEPEQQPAQQAQPQQPTEQQQLAQERWRIANLKRMEGHEVAARLDYDQTVRAVLAEFPGLQTARPTPQHIEELRQKDPARFQRLMQADAALRQRQQRIAAMAQQRGRTRTTAGTGQRTSPICRSRRTGRGLRRKSRSLDSELGARRERGPTASP